MVFKTKQPIYVSPQNNGENFIMLLSSPYNQVWYHDIMSHLVVEAHDLRRDGPISRSKLPLVTLWRVSISPWPELILFTIPTETLRDSILTSPLLSRWIFSEFSLNFPWIFGSLHVKTDTFDRLSTLLPEVLSTSPATSEFYNVVVRREN